MKPAVRRLVAFLPVYAVLVLLAGLLWRQPLLLAACYLVLTAGLLYAVRPRRVILAYFLIGFVLGPAGELVAISLGAWSYSVTHLLPIPVWLPLAWGIAAVAMKQLADGLAALLDASSPGR